MLLILTLILTFIPAFFWLAVFLRKDRVEPEPKRLIILIFILGGAAALVAANLEIEVLKFIPKNYLVSVVLIFFVVSVIEEYAKIAVVRFFAFNSNHFNQVVDGAIFGITSGLGFATVENFGYLNRIANNQTLLLLLILFILRFLGSSLLHAITTGVAGYFLGKAKFSGNYNSFWLAIISSILLHTSFNLFLFGNLLGLAIQVLLLIIILVFLLRRMGSVEGQYIRNIISIRDRDASPISGVVDKP